MSSVFRHILLTGATGQLGSHIAASDLFQNLLTPTRKTLDLCDSTSVEKYFKHHTFDAVIHTAAVARMREAEKNPAKTLQTNLLGTSRLVEQILHWENKKKKPIRFIHISTDGVYPGLHGNYKETDFTQPYNRYGWTKLGAECAVHLLKNFCIIRTRFFDPKNIRFKTHAVDSHSSSVPIQDLVQAIHLLLNSSFVGTMNVGGQRMSDYARLKKFNPSAKPCRLRDITKDLPFALSQDASLNCRQWKELQRQSAAQNNGHR